MFLMQTKTAFAQDDEEDAPKSYVVVYILMIFFVGLALMTMLRTSKRSVSFRQDDTEE